MLVLLFWENPRDHRRLEPLLRQGGYEVVATDDPQYFTACLSLVKADLLLMEVASEEAPALRLLRAIRAEALSEVPAIVLSEIDGLEFRAVLGNLHATIRAKKKAWIANLMGELESRAVPAGQPVLQYFPA